VALQTKICNACQQEKPFLAFSVTKPGRGDKNNLRSRCKECRSAINLAWHKSNPIKTKKNRRSFYIKNIENEKKQSQLWAIKNPKRKAVNFANWATKNRSKLTSKQQARDAKKRQAMPNWLTPIHLAQIQEMYDIANARTFQTGIQHHVDHIVPLQGDTVSGLHVPWNLQVLTAFENISKKNKFDHNVNCQCSE